jgi:hypothetical protein
MNSNQSKAKTLGMPAGTAAGRLRKLILFDLLQRHKENICSRCLKLIETADELSIEHLLPWEGISADLFWDLKNIAFSHMACNRPHRNIGGAALRKKSPEGMAWCNGCQKDLPVSCFWKAENRWNGLQNYCKVCKEAHKTDR